MTSIMTKPFFAVNISHSAFDILYLRIDLEEVGIGDSDAEMPTRPPEDLKLPPTNHQHLHPHYPYPDNCFLRPFVLCV